MSINRSSFLTGAATLAALPALGSRAGADDLVVKTGLIPADIGAAAEFARELGYFRDAGIDVEIEVMQSGPAIAPAVIGGSLSVGAMNSGSLAGARERGLPVLYFAPAAMTPPASLANAMVVRSDAPIHSGADMNGKTVGIVAVKTLEHACMLLWVDKHGGDSKTLKFTELPYGEMSAALQAGRIDVCLCSEPFATLSTRTANRVVAGVFAAMPGPFLSYGYFATEAWLTANAAAATKYAAAIHRASLWANAHKKESGQMVASFTKLDPALVESMARTQYATSLDAAAIQPAVDVMVRYGMLPATIDAHALIWKPSKT
jgi:NitT/TauT family transport system substrate-binding protein